MVIAIDASGIICFRAGDRRHMMSARDAHFVIAIAMKHPMLTNQIIAKI
jgi:hypothetical protein